MNTHRIASLVRDLFPSHRIFLFYFSVHFSNNGSWKFLFPSCRTRRATGKVMARVLARSANREACRVDADDEQSKIISPSPIHKFFFSFPFEGFMSNQKSKSFLFPRPRISQRDGKLIHLTNNISLFVNKLCYSLGNFPRVCKARDHDKLCVRLELLPSMPN